MRLKDVFEGVEAFPVKDPQDPFEALIRRVHGGDEAVIKELVHLSREQLIALATKLTHQKIRSGKQAIEAIKDEVFQSRFSKWQSDQIDKYFPPPAPPEPSKGWEPSKDDGPKVLQFPKRETK